MIERFNFYDVYGYLLPGVVLIGMLWFPLWLVGGREVPGAWSAAVALVLGYAAGHVVARLGEHALQYDALGQQPSDTLLDPEDPRLPESTKRQIIKAVERDFNLTLNIEDKKERERRLRAAFFMCRRALLREEAASYAEQFQGLYSLMRGWAAVAILSFGYYLGWAATDLLVTPLFVDFSWFAIVPLLIVLTVVSEKRWLLWVLTALLFPVGLLLGATLVPTRLSPETVLLLFAIAFGSVLLAIRFYLGYRYFADQFAVTVYRDFFVLDALWSRSQSW